MELVRIMLLVVMESFINWLMRKIFKSQLPDGRTGLNTCSIGIELMTSFTESPTAAQIESLANLVKDIKLRYPVKYVLRHSDVAPGRKTDPWNMNWDDFLLLIQ